MIETDMIETGRLRLRPWTEAELPLLMRWNGDATVMQHFGGARTQEQTEARFRLMQGWQRSHGFSFWALERKADGVVIGNAGLKPLTVPWPEPTDIEIGWLLAPEAWGQGYAQEAAQAALKLGLTLAPRVIAMVAQTNRSSQLVAERIGMERAPELDFAHPDLPTDSPFSWHVVYGKSA